VQLAYEGGRLAGESDFLRKNNVPDINPSASVGLHVEWTRSLARCPSRCSRAGDTFVDRDRGAQADLRFTAGIYGGGAISAGVIHPG